jgi:hypothetical protein
MALGEFTKQLAQQALLNATKEPAPAAPQPDNFAATLIGQITAMQKALKEEDDFTVFFHQGTEKIRVMEIFMPSWRVAVLSGVDPDRCLTRVVSPVDCLQLVAKVSKGQPGARPARVAVILPKA